jgi:hypothetical protein
MVYSTGSSDGAFEHVTQIAFVEEMRPPNGAIGRQIGHHLAPAELLQLRDHTTVTRVTHGDVESSLLERKGDQRMGPGILLGDQAQRFCVDIADFQVDEADVPRLRQLLQQKP